MKSPPQDGRLWPQRGSTLNMADQPFFISVPLVALALPTLLGAAACEVMTRCWRHVSAFPIPTSRAEVLSHVQEVVLQGFSSFFFSLPDRLKTHFLKTDLFLNIIA